MDTAADTATAERMVALCLRTGPDGRRVYSDAEVAAFLPALLFAFAPALDANKLQPAVRALVGTLAQRLGVDGTDPAAARRALQAHFEAHPPSAGLVQDFQRLFREELKDRLPGGAASAFASFVGADAPKPLARVGSARPEGTVPASPFARFQVQDKPTKKDG